MRNARGCMAISIGSGFPAPWLNTKEHRAIATIKDWLNLCDKKCYLSISGGKDSLVAAHLIRRVYPDCPLVWVNQGHLAEWSDCIQLLELLKNNGWNIVEICPVRDLWHLYLDLGIPLSGKMTSLTDKQINRKLVYDPLEEYQERNDTKGYAWGIRASESKGRSLYLKSHGELYQRKDGLYCCSPIGWWKTQDIWSYIDKHKLPYPAMYDQDRLRIRNGPPIGTTGVNWGRLAELRRHYPEIWQELVNGFPELTSYA